ncbi:hypothetical protein ABW21_db0200039 [Orbilia brochopaga]|nr:hypothetical protein ABW21_db0200039 [Drechslerella brochopaga]
MWHACTIDFSRNEIMLELTCTGYPPTSATGPQLQAANIKYYTYRRRRRCIVSILRRTNVHVPRFQDFQNPGAQTLRAAYCDISKMIRTLEHGARCNIRITTWISATLDMHCMASHTCTGIV